MDNRKKQINDLERQKKEQNTLLESLLTHFGETLFSRSNDLSPDTSSFGELGAYRRFQNDITESETAIQAVEEQISRYQALDEGIEAKELDISVCLTEIAVQHGNLGKALLEIASLESAKPVAESTESRRL